MNRLTRLHTLLVLLLSLAVALPLSVGAGDGSRDGPRSPRGPSAEIGYVQEHVVVKLAPGARSHALGPGTRQVGRGWITVPTPPGMDAADFAAGLVSNPAVEVATVDRIYELHVSVPFTPNDPWWVDAPNRQWHMHRIDLPAAWQHTVGAGVRVAVIDTGVSNGSLDGFCNPFVAEYDALFDISGPGQGVDYDGHGSHVAGSIAQCGGNGTWGTGVAPDALILPVNAFWHDGAPESAVARGIYWAIDNGARVINLSLGFPGGSSSLMSAAISAAVSADVVVVASAGNEGGAVFYPASHPGVIAVGAVGFDNTVTSYSSRGTGLELVAPGGTGSAGIWQEAPPVSSSSYVGLFGTSMAAPHVSGVASLLRARHRKATAIQVREAMRCSALDLGPGGWDAAYGWGLVQAGAALAKLGQMVSSGSASCVNLPASASKVAAVGTTTGFWELWHGTDKVGSFYYGNPGDIPFMGDWNCDGIATPGLYRQSDGFVYLRNSNTQGIADITFFFGNPGDIPMVGDFNGDDCDTVSIYRPAEARFYIINKLGTNGGGLGAADYSFLFGNPGDVPFMGDWNGNGVDTPGLRRPSDGFVYLRNSNTQGIAHISFFYGNPGDVVFAGDWDGNDRDSIGLYRPSNGTVYLRNALSTGIADTWFVVGTGRLPAAGDF